MKGNIEVHWEEPGTLVRDKRVDRKSVFLEEDLDRAKELYKSLRHSEFKYNIRLMVVERYTQEGDPNR